MLEEYRGVDSTVEGVLSSVSNESLLGGGRDGGEEALGHQLVVLSSTSLEVCTSREKEDVTLSLQGININLTVFGDKIDGGTVRIVELRDLHSTLRPSSILSTREKLLDENN